MKHNEKQQDQLQKLLTELNLTVAAAKLPELLLQAQQKQLGYSDFLLAALQAESKGRFERKLARRLKRSGLGRTKSLDEFDFSIRPKLSPAAVKELLACRWVKEGRSIICVGMCGRGKTHVAKAIAHAAIMNGFSVYYKKAADLLDELHASLADNTYQKVFRRYVRADVIGLDELGYLSFDSQKADYLFRLVSARHPERPMIVASNTGFQNWGRFFPSQAQGIATIDRLIDRATILRFTGKGFRKPEDIHGAPIDEDDSGN